MLHQECIIGLGTMHIVDICSSHMSVQDICIRINVG